MVAYDLHIFAVSILYLRRVLGAGPRGEAAAAPPIILRKYGNEYGGDTQIIRNPQYSYLLYTGDLCDYSCTVQRIFVFLQFSKWYILQLPAFCKSGIIHIATLLMTRSEDEQKPYKTIADVTVNLDVS